MSDKWKRLGELLDSSNAGASGLASGRVIKAADEDQPEINEDPKTMAQLLTALDGVTSLADLKSLYEYSDKHFQPLMSAQKVTQKIRTKATRTTEATYDDLQPALEVPTIIFNNDDDAQKLTARLKLLATKGVVLLPDKNFIGQLGNKTHKRNYLRAVNAHNDKLGFDWSIPKKSLVADPSGTHFKGSQYFLNGGFIMQAAQLHENTAYGNHLVENLQNFANNNLTTMSTPPAQMLASESRAIRGLQAMLEETRAALQDQKEREWEVHSDLAETTQQLQKLRGEYENLSARTILGEQLVDFPRIAAQHARALHTKAGNHVETIYQKSLVDPFAPQVQGVRIPTKLPQDVVTYQDYQEYDTTANGFCVLANFALHGRYSAFIVNNPGFAAAIKNGVPVGTQGTACYVRDSDTNVQCQYIPLVSTTDAFVADLVELNSDTSPYFTRARTVAAGIRMFKTSVSDTERGVLDQIYGQEGLQVDENAPLSKHLAKPRFDRQRTYLAQAGHQDHCCRGRVGYVSQTNYRPHDPRSFDYRDSDLAIGNSAFWQPGGEVEAFWFLTQDGADLRIWGAHELPMGQNLLGIVLESFQQRHTSYWNVENLEAGMSFTVDFVRHLEGHPDQSHYGFAQMGQANLETASTTMELVARTDPNGIFNGYSRNRKSMLMDMQLTPIRGNFWGETLFPMFKDLVRYGADYLEDEDNLEQMVQMAVDAGALALQSIFPQSMPFLASVLPAVENAAKKAAKPIPNILHDWTTQ